MDELKQRWQDLSTQFNARSLRERLLMTAGGIAVVVVLFDTLVLNPLAVQHKRLSAQVVEVRNLVKAGEMLITAAQGRADPDEVKRRYRDELRKQIAEIDGKLQGLQKQLVPPDQVTKLLEGVLQRERGLALVSLHKLPVMRYRTVGGKLEADSKQATSAVDRSIYQHSFEIVVEGSYTELYGYLEKLEKLPWQLFWGNVELDAGTHPRLRLKLTVHTLSLNRVWLIV